MTKTAALDRCACPPSRSEQADSNGAVTVKERTLKRPTAYQFTAVLAAAAILALAACSKPPTEEKAATTPAAAQKAAEAVLPSNPLREAYFGETHVHTEYSLDAFISGTRLSPSDAYRFAKGEEVTVDGKPHRINKPLDFAAVTDHAEYIGEMYSAMNPGAPGYDQDLLKQLRSMTDINERRQWFMKYVISNNRSDTPSHPPFFAGPETVKSAWKVMIDAANQHNQPGHFTAFVAFEWSGAPKGANLHRNVIFRDDNVPDAPLSYIDSNREDGLWEWMAGLEAKGMKPLAIPHNSNASKTMMFAPFDAKGNPIDKAYAERRQHFEPLIELMQIKGNSEVNAKFWGADEFAGFENADSLAKFSGRVLDQRNYVRWAEIQGLAYEQSLGVNPYKLGFVGGTDNHNGVPSDVAEKGWVGGHGPEDGSVEARRTGTVGGWADSKDLNPGALSGVWATQNTRGALWDAMERRETFTTSGTRMKVRFFGGMGLAATTDPELLVQRGYDQGVPMGGDLKGAAGHPTFNVYAMKDPDGANLDRIQIIKGWVDKSGKPHEKIVDVAWSGARKCGADGKLPPVGNTVDLTKATYTNTIGSPEIIGSWTDKDFEPTQHALYYVRALEIPTPRWSTYDAVAAGLPLLKDEPATIQERAWSSPIWYSPQGTN